MLNSKLFPTTLIFAGARNRPAVLVQTLRAGSTYDDGLDALFATWDALTAEKPHEPVRCYLQRDGHITDELASRVESEGPY